MKNNSRMSALWKGIRSSTASTFDSYTSMFRWPSKGFRRGYLIASGCGILSLFLRITFESGGNEAVASVPLFIICAGMLYLLLALVYGVLTGIFRAVFSFACWCPGAWRTLKANCLAAWSALCRFFGSIPRACTRAVNGWRSLSKQDKQRLFETMCLFLLVCCITCGIWYLTKEWHVPLQWLIGTDWLAVLFIHVYLSFFASAFLSVMLLALARSFARLVGRNRLRGGANEGNG